MKKSIAFFALLTVLFSFNACKKDSGDNSASNNNINDSSCTVSPIKIGSVSTYSTSSSSYTININGNYTFNGKNYFTGTSTSGTTTTTGYIYTDPTNGDDWQMIPAMGDLPQQEMIYCKPSQPVGTTWSYTFASVSTAGITYKYTFSIVKKGVSFTLGSSTNKNCTQSQCVVETLYNGVSMGSNATMTYTFACDWGLVQTLQNGSVYSTLTAFKY